MLKDYKFINISLNRFHDDYVNEVVLKESINECCITQEHIDASAENIRILGNYLPKFVLHLRDPRQAMLSWLYHVEENKTNHYGVWSDDICPSIEYFSWSLEKKIDWQIENYLPQLVQWIQQWVNIINSKKFDILVTRYEDLVENPELFFENILKFYNLQDTKTILTKPEKNKWHFRKGQIDEWKTVLNSKQIIRMHELIPIDLLEYFSWENVF